MPTEEDRLTPAEAVAIMADGDSVHTFVNPNIGMMIGADHSRTSLVEDINTAIRLELTGPMASRMNYGLALWRSESHLLFVATKPHHEAVLAGFRAGGAVSE